MKQLFSLISVSIIFLSVLNSCNQATEKESTPSIIEEEVIKFPKEYIGLYFTEAYINSLKVTKSPKESQNLAYFSGFVIYERNDSVFTSCDFNHHEGGWELPLIMTGRSTAKIPYSDNPSEDALITFNDDGSLIINDKEWKGNMIKVHQTPDLRLINDGINSILFPEEFNLNNEFVSFNANGTLSGIDSISSYYIYADYWGPGMDLDMIDLMHTEDSSRIYTFGFELSDSGMQIFQLKCIDQDDDLCLQNIKGDVIYDLKFN